MSDTPRTDAVCDRFSRGLIGSGEVRVFMEQLEREIATETKRRERDERLLREFCQENPTRWTRLELMEIRDQLVEALEDVMDEHVDRHDTSESATKARKSIAAAKSYTPPE